MLVTEIFTVWILLRSAASKAHYFLMIVLRPARYRWMFSSCGIGFIFPALCRLEMGTTCGCTGGDFSSPMKYGTIASAPGRISDYQTFKLILILCMNKNCCKPFLRSLNCWKAARSPFLFSQHRLWKAGIVNQVGWRKGWSVFVEASPVCLTMLHLWAALFRRIFFLHLSQLRKSPYPPLSAFPQYRGCYATTGKYRNFPRVPSWFSFSLNKTKFNHHKSLSAVWRAPQSSSQRRRWKLQEWMWC